MKTYIITLRSKLMITLGKDLVDFLIQENFELIPGVESHDVYHLILEYSTTVEQEAQMQFFLFGNGKRSLYAMGTSIIAFLTMPDQWLAFWRAYCRGQKSLKIHLWGFRFLLKEKTANLRTLVNRQSNQIGLIQPHYFKTLKNYPHEFHQKIIQTTSI